MTLQNERKNQMFTVSETSACVYEHPSHSTHTRMPVVMFLPVAVP